MSKQLIESIISNNMLEANDMVEAKLAEIRERKMCEMKRMFAAKMDEVFGSKSVKQLRDLGFKPAHKVLGLSPYDKGREEAKKKHADIKASAEKKTEKEKVDEGVVDDVSHAVKKGIKRTKTRLKVMSYVPGAMKDIAAQGAKEAGKSAYGAALKGISDPLDTAAKATVGAAKAAKATAGGVKKGLSAIANSRLGRKIAAHEPEAPGSKVLRATKRLANSQITQDVKDIAFRNI
jgi:hypothetical protein